MFLTCASSFLVAASLMAAPSHADDQGLSDSDEVSYFADEPYTTPPIQMAVDKAISKLPLKGITQVREFRVLRQRVGPPRFYPLLGPAHKIESHVRCVLDTANGKEVVDVDVEQLRIIPDQKP